MGGLSAVALTISIKDEAGEIFCEPPFGPPAGSDATSKPEVLKVEVTINFGSDDGKGGIEPGKAPSAFPHIYRWPA